jgi:hypothetical protein
MSTIALPGHLAIRPLVGEEVPARHLNCGDTILIEAHEIAGHQTGPREIVAIITYSRPVSPDWQLIEYVGAVTGDLPHPPVRGATLYDRAWPVTLLLHDYELSYDLGRRAA